MGIFQWIWDSILGLFNNLLNVFLILLPDSPFQKVAYDLKNSPFGDTLAYINYFVPIGQMVGFLSLYLTAVTIWYICRWALRLAQYID